MPIKTYPITRAQIIPILQKKVSLHKGFDSIPLVFTIEQGINFDKLSVAIDMETERNDSLRIKFIRENKETVQTFLPPFKYSDVMGKIELYDFTGKTKEYQDSVIKKLSTFRLNIKKAENIKFFYLKTFDGRYGFLVIVSHLCCDAFGLGVTLSDIFNIYRHLEYGDMMPEQIGSFEKIVDDEAKVSPERIKADVDNFHDYFEKLGKPKKFSSVVDKRLPHKKREGRLEYNILYNLIVSLFNDASTRIQRHISSEMLGKMENFCKSEGISMNTFITFCVSAYLAKINNDNDVIFHQMANCRFSNSSKKTAGILNKTITYRDVIDDSSTVEDCVSKISQIMLRCLRHSNPPPTLLELERNYNIFIHNSYGSLLYSVLDLRYDALKDWNYRIELIDPGFCPVAEYLVIYHDIENGGLIFNFDYRTSLLNQAQIDNQFNGLCDVINAVVSDKNKTFKQIKDSIK